MATDLHQLNSIATRRLEDVVGTDTAVMLVARTVLIRLLIERGHLPAGVVHGLGGDQPYGTYETAVRANQWLDRQFVGEKCLPVATDYERLFSNLLDAARLRGHGGFQALANIFSAIRPPQGYLLSWSFIDFAAVRPIILAEAFDRALSKLVLPPRSRTTIRFTPAALAAFMVEEAMEASVSAEPAVLSTSIGCGQMLVAALEQMVAADWERIGRRPNGESIRGVVAKRLRGITSSTRQQQLATAILTLAALDLCPEPHPLSSAPFPMPETTISDRSVQPGFDIVVGDRSGDGDYGRAALSEALGLAAHGAIVALTMGKPVLKSKGLAVPPILRPGARLTGLLTDVQVHGRRQPVAILFARNEKPAEDAEFWLTIPFSHRHPARGVPGWIDASRSMPISQALATRWPGLLQSLPTLSVLEAGVLIRILRNLAMPSLSTNDQDEDVQTLCRNLISDSQVGNFVRLTLGSSYADRVLSDASLVLTPAILRVAIKVVAQGGAPAIREDRKQALVEMLCGLDSGDFAIMGVRLGTSPSGELQPSDFAQHLEQRLSPFWEGLSIRVAYLAPISTSALHVFEIHNASGRSAGDLRGEEINGKVAHMPVGSISVVGVGAGRLVVMITSLILTAESAWIVALDVLRNHANALDDEGLWPGD